MLIIIAGYIIATGILTVAETTIGAQIEMSTVLETIQQTKISVNEYVWSDTENKLSLYILNDGSVSFKRLDSGYDLFICNSATNVTTRYSLSDITTRILDDVTNKGYWDPSETIELNITLAYTPNWAKFVTSNGITVSTNIIT
ncbi:hypothetical protein [Methanospirillum sp.]|uniref:hypothetical protein n=1 Tax=Methanospirillum sp. TaxID=45200 RepID=UPI002D1FA5E0|nr:hypothetical protein [Methanospirillum sp.]